jgi:phosphoserine phosphatase
MAVRAIILDMDGTAVQYEQGDFHSSWDALGHRVCDREEWDEGVRRYYGRPEAYEEWLQYNARLLAGVSLARARELLLPGGKPPYSPGFEEFFAGAAERYVCGLISSGVDLVCEAIRMAFGFAFAISNRLEAANGRFTGGAQLRVPLWEKERVLREVAAARGLGLEEICFVGDNENDLGVLAIVGVPVLFRPRERLLAHPRAGEVLARARVITDFRELAEVLGEDGEAVA